MTWFSWIFVVPALLYVGVGLLWWMRGDGALRRMVALLPLLACYGMSVALLVMGGCHRVAHVKLEGVEVDLTDRAGRARVLAVGGGDAALSVPGYPEDAMSMVWDGSWLRVSPGRGYAENLVVRSDRDFLRIADGRMPRLVPLEDGDVIRLGASSGGVDEVSVILGTGERDVTPPPSGVRWLGASGDGAARMVGLPDQVVGLGSVGKVNGGLVVMLMKSPSSSEDVVILVDGQEVDFTKSDKVGVRYRPGLTRITVMRRDPLRGAFTWFESGMMGRRSGLSFDGDIAPQGIVLTNEESMTVGGGAGDDVVIRGLAPRRYIVGWDDNELMMTDTQSGEKQSLGLGTSLEIKTEGGDPAGSLSLGPASDQMVTVVWQPDVDKEWILPNRIVSLPVVGWKVPVFVRRAWTQRIYPLATMTSAATGVRSAVVYGAPGLSDGQAGLLVLDSGITVERNGQELPLQAQVATVGTNEPLRFYQEVSTESGGRRMRLRKRTGALQVAKRTNEDGVEIPYLSMPLNSPWVRSIPIDTLEDDADEDKSLGGRVAFGVNERIEFATLPHQVRFRNLGGWFRQATGEVELEWLGMQVTDDYGKKSVDYGETFTVGGSDRLVLKVEKRTVPWKTIAWVVGAGVLALMVAWPWIGSFAGASLFFGAAFLSCSRLLMGRAVEVNAPYDSSVIEVGLWVALALPVVLSLAMAVGRWLSKKDLNKVMQRLSRVGYGKLSLIVFGLLLLRVVLLLLGVKEGLSVGGTRVALSILFVPLWILLFAAGVGRCLGSKDEGAKPSGGWPFLIYNGWLFAAQALAGIVVSDIGVFVFLIPQALVLAIIAVMQIVQLWRAPDKGIAVGALVSSVLLALPLALIMMFCFAPQVLLGGVSKFSEPLQDGSAIPTDSTALRVLQFLDKEYLINLGTDDAEAIAQDHAIMENYAHRGWFGEGFLEVDVIPAKYVTAMNDNVSAVFVFGQFGVAGACAVVIAYLAVALAAGGAMVGVLRWPGLLAGLTFAITSLYMIAANWGVTPFTGRNMYLLGLNSLGDVAEGFVLLCLVALAVAWKPAKTNLKEKANDE